MIRKEEFMPVMEVEQVSIQVATESRSRLLKAMMNDILSATSEGDVLRLLQ